jgi:hypothetical protein
MDRTQTEQTKPARVPPPELQPQDPPGEGADIGGEFTTEGVDKADWKKGRDPFSAVTKTDKLL